MIYPATEKYIEMAVNSLNDGDVIVYPTDTLYGFGVDATNTEAIHRLNRLKGRVQPLSIVLESIDQMHKYAKFDNSIQSKLEQLFPGNTPPFYLQNRTNYLQWYKMVLPKLVFVFLTIFSQLN